MITLEKIDSCTALLVFEGTKLGIDDLADIVAAAIKDPGCRVKGFGVGRIGDGPIRASIIFSEAADRVAFVDDIVGQIIYCIARSQSNEVAAVS